MKILCPRQITVTDQGTALPPMESLWWVHKEDTKPSNKDDSV